MNASICLSAQGGMPIEQQTTDRQPAMTDLSDREVVVVRVPLRGITPLLGLPECQARFRQSVGTVGSGHARHLALRRQAGGAPMSWATGEDLARRSSGKRAKRVAHDSLRLGTGSGQRRPAPGGAAATMSLLQTKSTRALTELWHQAPVAEGVLGRPSGPKNISASSTRATTRTSTKASRSLASIASIGASGISSMTARTRSAKATSTLGKQIRSTSLTSRPPPSRQMRPLCRRRRYRLDGSPCLISFAPRGAYDRNGLRVVVARRALLWRIPKARCHRTDGCPPGVTWRRSKRSRREPGSCPGGYRLVDHPWHRCSPAGRGDGRRYQMIALRARPSGCAWRYSTARAIAGSNPAWRRGA
jgi:hypothetical protein